MKRNKTLEYLIYIVVVLGILISLSILFTRATDNEYSSRVEAIERHLEENR